MKENKLIVEKLLEQRAFLVETISSADIYTNIFERCLDEIKRIDNFIKEINV